MGNRKKTEAFVLTSRKWSDNSLIITGFTPDQGLLKLIAKGAVKPQSPLRGAFEIFNLVELVYSEKVTRQLQILTEVNIIHHFPVIHQQPAGLAGLYLMAEILLLMIHEHENADLLFRHLVRLMEWIEEHPVCLGAGILNFINAILSFSGYGLHFDHCSLCQNSSAEGQVGLVIRNGNYICLNCVKTESSYDKLFSSEIIRMLRQVYPYKNLIQFLPDISGSVWSAFIPILENYISFHIDKAVRLKSAPLFLQFL